MSTTFEILMNQLGIPAEIRNHEAFSQAEIEQVIVHKQSNIWEFRFVFENILPFELFLALKKGLKEEFSKTGNQATFEIKTKIKIFQESFYRPTIMRLFQMGLVLVKDFGPCIRIFKSVLKMIN